MKYQHYLAALAVLMIIVVACVVVFDPVGEDVVGPELVSGTSDETEGTVVTEPQTRELSQILLVEEDPCIVLLGDSITAGVGSSDYEPDGELVIQKSYDGVSFDTYRNLGTMSWGARFEAYMESTYPGCDVINNGIPGYTVWELWDSVDELIPEDCDVAIIQIGTNSRNAENKERSIVKPLEDLIGYLINKGIVPVVMSNTVLVDQVAPNDEYAVRECIRSACVNCGVQFFDVLGEMESFLRENELDERAVMKDTLHPNDRGHELIFNIYRQLLCV